MSAVMENIVFLPSTGQLAMHNFFSSKNMFTVVPTKEERTNLKDLSLPGSLI